MSTYIDGTMHRFAVAGGLRSLADFIEHFLDLPVPGHPIFNVAVIADTDSQERDEIDRIAELLGVTPELRYGGHYYVAECAFGPVHYIATAISEEHMRREQSRLDQLGNRFPDKQGDR